MKKLIFCFDGTCNDPSDSGDFFSDSSISNVLKMHALFGGQLKNMGQKHKDAPGQHSFYYSGIGTRGSWLRQKVNSMFAPPGADMDDILKEARKHLKRHYKKGDEIFVFGFSRGAAIARMFAAKHVQKREVKLLGVFDTVAATKNSLDLRKGTYPASGIVFENGTISAHVKKAVHLVSIDEKRVLFQPTLFNKDKRVEEMWLAGVHSDVGGGYWFDGLSDIALQIMIDRAEAEGLKVLDAGKLDYDVLAMDEEEDADKICQDDINIKPLATGIMHEQIRSGAAGKITLAPRLVRVNVNDKPSKKDVPIIHESVQERFAKVAGYRPYALRNIMYRLSNDGPGVKRKGIADLV